MPGCRDKRMPGCRDKRMTGCKFYLFFHSSLIIKYLILWNQLRNVM
jgi:hypothetical protein